ncbi:MAG: hypothetical protein LBE84_06255 [Planctomycetota bacterium]|nr:hypothetical protein [Planctomycetota bacterium]
MPKRVGTEVRRHKLLRRLLRQALFLSFSLVMFLLVIGGAIAGAMLLWREAMRDSRFHLDGDMLGRYGALRECPESVNELAAIGRRFNGRSLFDPSLLPDLEREFGRSVWVKKMLRLRRAFPNRVEMEYVLRLPAAQVWRDSRYWLIDGEGILLPTEGTAEPFQKLPTLTGVAAATFLPNPRPGEIWRDEGIIGALEIIRSFWASPLYEILPVEKVVVSSGSFRQGVRDREKRRRYEIVAAEGIIIRWGTHNPSHDDGEPSAAEKLRTLSELLAAPEAMEPGICLDVRTRLPGFTLFK